METKVALSNEGNSSKCRRTRSTHVYNSALANTSPPSMAKHTEIQTEGRPGMQQTILGLSSQAWWQNYPHLISQQNPVEQGFLQNIVKPQIVSDCHQHPRLHPVCEEAARWRQGGQTSYRCNPLPSAPSATSPGVPCMTFIVEVAKARMKEPHLI